MALVPLYPVGLKIEDRLCVVIGGGTVAARKIEGLLVCGARVRVVSPELDERIAQLLQAGQAGQIGKIEWLARGYAAGDLTGAFLAFAATDRPDVQALVAVEAEAQGILLNSIDNQEQCTFQVPAQVRSGELLLTVATGGNSPALAAKIRAELAHNYGPEYGLLIRLMGEIRRQVVVDQEQEAHRRLFHAVLQTAALQALREGDWDLLRQELARVLPQAIDPEQLLAGLQQQQEGDPQS